MCAAGVAALIICAVLARMYAKHVGWVVHERVLPFQRKAVTTAVDAATAAVEACTELATEAKLAAETGKQVSKKAAKKAKKAAEKAAKALTPLRMASPSEVDEVGRLVCAMLPAQHFAIEMRAAAIATDSDAPETSRPTAPGSPS